MLVMLLWPLACLAFCHLLSDKKNVLERLSLGAGDQPKVDKRSTNSKQSVGRPRDFDELLDDHGTSRTHLED